MQQKLMKASYIEKIYAGWLSKIIGIRLGAPIEGWSYEKIKNLYGAADGYLVDYREFAADDDSNGPIFFVRALEDKKTDAPVTASDIGDALLNYAPFEHGFFWWGGYGISTEHTAYLNLRNGIPAPESGSIRHNGIAAAEQIGGQIFIDCWGLVSPANPTQAASLAAKAASVTHDGNGIYGGIFIAVLISAAFEETDIEKLIETGLSYIPSDCEYTRAVRAVLDFYHTRPENWEDCFQFIHDNFGYDKYPGNCHIIPNICVMILSLLYGRGDYDTTLNICNRCGWDTDCNVGNVAAIMGVRGGLDAINDSKWRRPINDFLACSSVVGDLNIQDIPYGAVYMIRCAAALSGSALPGIWHDIAYSRDSSCHFEFPGSTHAMRLKGNETDGIPFEGSLSNSDEQAHTGRRSLKITAKNMCAGSCGYLYKKTYYRPEDFHDSRYDPAFSPTLYPGQTLRGSLFIPEYSTSCYVSCYVRDGRSRRIYTGEKKLLTKNRWHTLEMKLHDIEDILIDEAGFVFLIPGEGEQITDFVMFADDIEFKGQPSYTLNFSNETIERWPGVHREISQCTRLKGNSWLENKALHLSCHDFGEMYTGLHTMADYTAQFSIMPVCGQWHGVNFCVQGALRSYCAALLSDGRFALLKNDGSYKELASTPFSWETGQTYTITVSVRGSHLTAAVGNVRIDYTDTGHVYSHGSIGFSVRGGSHCAYFSASVRENQNASV